MESVALTAQNLIAKIVSGFLTGLGFAAAIATAFYAIEQWDSMKRDDRRSTYKQYTKDAGLAIESHHSLPAGSNTAFVGTLENHGKDRWRGVQIMIEMFDGANRFLDKRRGNEYFGVGDEGVGVDPGESKNFKIECFNTPAFDHYTITVENAQFLPPPK